MSKVQMLRALVKQRLTAAAEDIFGLFERTIAEYEETLCRSKEENERQRRLLDAVFNPQLRLHRAGFPADVQQLLVIKEEVPPEQQQEWSSSLDQEDPEPPHVKEEQEELGTSQEGEHLQGLEAGITKFTFTPVPVKSEDDDEEKPQSSQLHQRQTDKMRTEADGENCGEPEPDRKSHPGTHLQPISEDNSLDSIETDVSDGDCEETREPQSSKLHQPQIGQMGTEADGGDCGGQTECRLTDYPDSHLTSDTEDKTGDSSETDISDGDWEATRKAQSGLNSPDVLVSDECPTEEKPFSCSVCCKGFSQKDNLIRHMTHHTGEKLFSCPVCEKRFRHRGAAGRHIKIHTEEKPFSCSVCHKAFRLKAFLLNHMNIHTGEKPFSCSVCGRRFSQKVNVQTHMRIHTEEREAKGKPFSCSVCDKLFNRRSHFIEHMRRHTGEKPFICPVCHKAFCVKSILVTHMKIHTGEKPFSCSICGKRFTQKGNLMTHMGLHTKDSVDCESRQHIAESSSSR